MSESSGHLPPDRSPLSESVAASLVAMRTAVSWLTSSRCSETALLPGQESDRD